MPEQRAESTVMAAAAQHAPLILVTLLFAVTAAGLITDVFPHWAWILLAPLLVAAPGMFKRRLYTYRWLSLTLTFFLVFGFTEMIANPQIRIWSAALVALSVLLFLSLVLGLRHATRQKA